MSETALTQKQWAERALTQVGVLLVDLLPPDRAKQEHEPAGGDPDLLETYRFPAALLRCMPNGLPLGPCRAQWLAASQLESSGVKRIARGVRLHGPAWLCPGPETCNAHHVRGEAGQLATVALERLLKPPALGRPPTSDQRLVDQAREVFEALEATSRTRPTQLAVANKLSVDVRTLQRALKTTGRRWQDILQSSQQQPNG